MEEYVPDVYQESIYKINYKILKEKGIKCLLFDLDNTLVPFSNKTANEDIKNLFNELKKDFRIIIFSNSPKIRVRQFRDELDVDTLACARKPHRRSFLKILETYKYDIEEVAIIGDQLNTDILGGNRVGITTILINPVSKKDPFWTRPGRLYERRIMKKLNDRDLFFKGRYYE